MYFLYGPQSLSDFQYDEGELERKSTVRNFRTVQRREVRRETVAQFHSNLQTIDIYCADPDQRIHELHKERKRSPEQTCIIAQKQGPYKDTVCMKTICHHVDQQWISVTTLFDSERNIYGEYEP